MTWFEKLTGCEEQSPEQVRQQLLVDGPRLHSRANGKSWIIGELEISSLAVLREKISQIELPAKPISCNEVVANVQHLHRDPANRHAMFQVASQFNLLEMISPGVTPEQGIGIYEGDLTQGPACAVAAGAGTIFRNYFVEINGQIGQTADRQIDCLSGIGQLLGNVDQRLWRMSNGYALPTRSGLEEINQKLNKMDQAQLDHVRQALRIGIQWDTQVTLDGVQHVISQAYCSAMPVAYNSHPDELWGPLANLVLEAAYEATVCAAIINYQRTGNHQLFLTLLGGGAFGNRTDWIISSIDRSLKKFAASGLAISIVSYGRSNPAVYDLLCQ